MPLKTKPTKERILYTRFKFTDIYMMCIIEQLSKTVDKGQWSECIVGNKKTNCNVYTYDDMLKIIMWDETCDSLFYKYKNSNVKFKRMSVVDFLWEILE